VRSLLRETETIRPRERSCVAFTFDDDFRQFGFTQLTDAVLDWQ